MWKILQKVMWDVKLRFWESFWVFKTVETGYFLISSCTKVKNWKWPLVCSNPNISASTWPKLKIKDSFEILRMSRFQNWPYFLNLVKIWWRYWQKTNCLLFCGHGVLLGVPLKMPQWLIVVILWSLCRRQSQDLELNIHFIR